MAAWQNQLKCNNKITSNLNQLLAIEKIIELKNFFYYTGNLRKIIEKSNLIVIPKKEGLIYCDKQRTISATSQVVKILLRNTGEKLRKQWTECSLALEKVKVLQMQPLY